MIRVHVHEDVMALNVDISIVAHPPEGDMDSRLRILRLPGGDQKYPYWEEIPSPYLTVDPTMRLGFDEARAVLDALTHHFHGADDARALRRDYDGERKRVDTLIDHLAAVARNLTAPVYADPAYSRTDGPDPVTLDGFRWLTADGTEITQDTAG